MTHPVSTYIGKKVITARPMTRAEYNTYRGWQLPENENGDDAGMLVEYIDGGESNHPDHSGYISWSLLEVFNRAYSIADSFQDRITIEATELFERYSKLTTFMKGDAFNSLSDIDQLMLRQQHQFMVNYLAILKLRHPVLDYELESLPREKVPYGIIESLVNSLTFRFHRVEGSNITTCHAFLPNNFQVGYGESGCLKDEDFNQELGEKYAKERAIHDATNKLWFGEGYARAMMYTA